MDAAIWADFQSMHTETPECGASAFNMHGASNALCFAGLDASHAPLQSSQVINGGQAVVVVTDGALGREVNLRNHLRHPMVGPAEMVLGVQQEYTGSALIMMNKYVATHLLVRLAFELAPVPPNYFLPKTALPHLDTARTCIVACVTCGFRCSRQLRCSHTRLPLSRAHKTCVRT